MKIRLLYIFALAFALGFNGIAKAADWKSEPLFVGLEKAVQTPEKVYKLCMGGQHLSSIPDPVLKMVNIRDLNLSQNDLVELPENISKLNLIEDLNLSGAGLKKINAGFFRLVNLRTLDLSSNPELNWDFFFENVIKFENLESLDLSYCELKKLNVNLTKLKKLKELNLYENSLDKAEIDKIRELMPGLKINM